MSDASLNRFLQDAGAPTVADAGAAWAGGPLQIRDLGTLQATELAQGPILLYSFLSGETLVGILYYGSRVELDHGSVVFQNESAVALGGAIGSATSASSWPDNTSFSDLLKPATGFYGTVTGGTPTTGSAGVALVITTTGVTSQVLPSAYADLVFWGAVDAVYAILPLTGPGLPLDVWGPNLTGGSHNQNQLASIGFSNLRPVWTNNVVNGWPALQFLPANQSRLDFFGPPPLDFSSFSFFAVVKPSAIGVAHAVIGDTTAGGVEFRFNASNHQEILVVGGASIGTGSATVSAVTPYLVEATYDGGTGNWGLWLNGTADGSGTNAQAIATGRAEIGACEGIGVGLNDAFDGYIAEILLYQRAVTGPERLSIESYLRTRYAL